MRPDHPPSRPQPGLLVALFDTRFRTLVTPSVITWIYRGCLAVITLITVWWLLLSVAVMTWRNGWMWGVLGLFAAPLIGLLLILVARVACEAVLIRFHRRV